MLVCLDVIMKIRFMDEIGRIRLRALYVMLIFTAAFILIIFITASCQSFYARLIAEFALLACLIRSFHVPLAIRLTSFDLSAFITAFASMFLSESLIKLFYLISLSKAFWAPTSCANFI